MVTWYKFKSAFAVNVTLTSLFLHLEADPGERNIPPPNPPSPLIFMTKLRPEGPKKIFGDRPSLISGFR